MHIDFARAQGSNALFVGALCIIVTIIIARIATRLEKQFQSQNQQDDH